MSNFNQINEIDKLYQSPLIRHAQNKIECPVCGKVYKQERSAIKHYEKQDCYKPVDVFSDTAYESYAYELYKQALAAGSGHRTSLKQFRKSPSYRVAIHFVLTCIIAGISDYGEYYTYLEEIKGYSMMTKIFSFGQREDHIEAYRFFRHKNGLIDSEEFYEKWKDDLEKDDLFLVNSILKAHISIYFVAKMTKLVEVIDSLPTGLMYQLELYIKEGDL